MNIGARPLVCGGDLNVCLNSRTWFMLFLVHISYLVLVLKSGDRASSYQLGPTE
jgi:hypothetical protein